MTSKEIIEEKIKEIVKEAIRNGHFNDTHGLEDVVKAIRQQTLEEADKCVPEEDDRAVDRVLWGYFAQGHNSCRQQTLSNLQALKDKNK